MNVLPALLVLGLLLATVGPRLLARASWVEREPVLALWAWQCLVVAVLLCCGLSMLLTSTAAWPEIGRLLFLGAPRGVEAAYRLPYARPWAVAGTLLLAYGGVRTAQSLTAEVRSARALRRRRQRELTVRAPELPAGLGREPAARERLVVLESARPQAWSLPGPDARLVVTTGALHRLSDRELAAALAHERGHVRARHHWLMQCAEALNTGFPGARVFGLFRSQVGRLVELAADDSAARRHGRLATAIALVELNPDHSPTCPAPFAEVPRRVDRLLTGEPRLPVAVRLRLTATALVALGAPVVLAFAPGLRALL
ncbi:M56 family metallopeptidase [Streptacidiphilus sp. PB12-B1b]|uniref:M56 family metallopeptidase n=1 Tax=Streptacidiphilus sp. PB12-B1b TaxID=2705012 RepID=UPI0015FD9900|nr:M56 family metallopeptidase [Streptacidiphilus sp. PB12-B1b]QMU76065.1 M56 family metallopeptidase [Streptacidiphilus sp. PB12-B1b]